MKVHIAHCWESLDVSDLYGKEEKTLSKVEREMLCRDKSATCLLQDGHDGPHEWTLDDEIEVTFK